MCASHRVPNPDSSRNHLTPFTEGPRAWLVLARNAIPVIGVYGLGWSAEVVMLQIWFDGVTALGAMLAFQMRGFIRNDRRTFEPPPGVPPSLGPWVLGLAWLVIWAVLSIPYWFILIFFSFAVFKDGLGHLLLNNVSVISALLLALASNIFEAHQRNYVGMNDADIRMEFNWEFNLHLAHVAAILLVTFFLRFSPILIFALALMLSYVEIYPMHTLRFLGGDRTLDTDNENRSRD